MQCVRIGFRAWTFLCGPVLWALMVACDKEATGPVELHLEAPVLPTPGYDYTSEVLPAWFDTPALNAFESTPEWNPVTDAGAALGRVLFYDRNLSANFSTRCASCHQQEHGFADPRANSRGFGGGITRRNAPHLVNHRYVRRQFWDERASTLEQQVLMPIQDPIEMGMSLDQVIERLRVLDHYPPLFAAAFGNDSITADRIARALAQFVRSLRSSSTRYDQGETDGFTSFTAEELEGKDLFFNSATRCNQCHMTANFFSPSAFNNGLDAPPLADIGLAEVTGDPEDEGKFKVPSLRNVARTAPYMHDGRFATLEEVVEHYNSGIAPHPTLDDRLTSDGVVGGTPYMLGLSPAQRHALVAFLKTLTDENMMNDVRYSDPFPH